MSALTILEDKRTFFARFNKAFLFGWAFVVVCGCGSSEERVIAKQNIVHQGDTQGTTYVIKYHGADSVDQRIIEEVLEQVDVEFNLWRPDSRINAVNAFKSHQTVFSFEDSNRLWSVLWDKCLEMHSASKGAFDPTVHPLVELWGFGLKNKTSVAREDVERILPHVGMTTDRIDLDEVEEGRIYQRTHVRKGDRETSIDFNAIAQGMTVDLLGDALVEHGVTDYMVEVGGEVKCMGVRNDGQPWRIAIDRPVDSSWGERPLQVVVNVQDAAICTSGNYRKFHEVDGVKRSHTISPFTGYPVTHALLSVTIKAVDASTADALATACMVWGPVRGRSFIKEYRDNHPEEAIEAYFISAAENDTHVYWKTEGWNQALLPEDQL